MSFQNVRIIDPYVENGMSKELVLTLVEHADVVEAEDRIGAKFPVGYSEYVTTLGRGAYCSFVRIDLPDVVASELETRRAFLDEYYFWNLAENVFQNRR